MCNVKESEKILDPGSAPNVSGVYSGMRPLLPPGFVENRLQDLCDSVDKPTTLKMDTGKTLTSLAEVIKHSTI